MDASKARSHLYELERTLKDFAERDPDQEVQGMAIRVLDTVIKETRSLLTEDPIAAEIRDVISVEAITEGQPVRAADALVVVRALQAAIGPEPLPLDLNQSTGRSVWDMEF